MIFVTVGTQKFQFDRLFKELDRLVEKGIIKDEIIAQAGFTNYKPIHFKTVGLVSAEKMDEWIANSRFVLSHAGTSSIIKSLAMDKKVVVVPRLMKYEEHVDNHQLEIAEVFEKKNLISVVHDIENLEEIITNIEKEKFSTYHFDNSKLINDIDDYLGKLQDQLKR
ncbi:glycosyltransferase family 28 [Fictibacillus nanhaiensis]|uniref:PssE/Cps14G family polysaccharide biosynthesis glycosyltransferase n=1 Tax=Fictibacillus nanhaiensis TaxID=742169 RepID=UPI001C93BE8B|nr:PssE/Cps14G family polysaccharide biosynthesis glycosyltransferase [Fictibacillus nanhaiensis]MBY6037097.1 glycosyltransferase family 28 [Fictibacillus nanhaiensis]